MASLILEHRHKRERKINNVNNLNKYYGYDENNIKNKYHFHNNPYDRSFNKLTVGRGCQEEYEEDMLIKMIMKNKETTKEGYLKNDFVTLDTESEEECSDDSSEEECSDDEDDSSEEECSDDEDDRSEEESEEECSDDEDDSSEEESEEECSDDEDDNSDEESEEYESE